MSNLGFITLKTQNNCAMQLKNEFNYGEKFIFLSGDSASGRTCICEKTVSLLESKLKTVFLPCQAHLSLEELRRLLLQQLSNTSDYDDTKPIALSFKEIAIPVRQRILIVVDDLDLVNQIFFDELLDLFKQSLGSNRLCFLVTGHSLWVESKISSNSNENLALKAYHVPSLDLNDANLLAQTLFKRAQLERLFEALKPKLPQYLEQARGNLGEIIKLTEKIMSDPIDVNDNNNQDELNSKNNSAKIFITILCILIVLACLTTVFLGTNLVNKIFNNDSIDANDTQAVSTEVQEQRAPTLPNANDESIALEPVANDQPADNNANSQDDNAVADNKVITEPFADDAQNSADPNKATEDDGVLLNAIEEGITLDGDKDSNKSVTIDGKALDKIENSQGNPRRGLDRPLDSNSADKVVSLVREDNALYKAAIQKEEQDKIIKAQKDEALVLALKQRALAQEAKAQEKQEEKVEAKPTEQELKQQADALAKKQEDEAKPKAQPQRVRAQAARRGSLDEISFINIRRYTLQLEAGTDRAALEATARRANGTYWIYETVRNDRPWYVLIAGNYRSFNEAHNSIRSLPSSIRRNGPFVKNFEKVQQEMRVKRGN